MEQDARDSLKKKGKLDFKDFVENLLVGAYQVDNQGEFIYVNDALAKILGYPNKNELLGKKIEQLYVDPNERKRLMEKLGNEGALVDETLRLRNKNNHEIYLSDSCQYIYDKNGNQVGFGGILMKVWSRKVLNEMNEGIYQVGADQKTLVRANIPVAKMFGYNHPEDIQGKNIGDFYKKKEDMETLKEILHEKRFVKNYPVEMLTKDNKDLVISVNASLLTDDKVGIIGREGTFRDITDDFKIRQILEDMPTGAYQVRKKDGEDNLLYCNKAFADMFGYSQDEIIGKKAIAFHSNKDVYNKFKNALLDADSKDKSLLDYKLHVKKKTGERFWVEIDSHLLKDNEENIIGRHGTVRDATIKIQLREIIRQKEDVERFSHQFMAPVMGMKSSSDALIEEVRQLMEKELFGISRDIFNKLGEDPFEILKAVKSISLKLIDNINDFVVLIPQSKRRERIRLEIEKFTNRLKIFSDEKRIENIIELRQVHQNLISYLFSLSNLFMEDIEIKKEINTVLDYLEDLAKFYILYLSQTISNTSKISYNDVENLRSYLLKGKIESELYDYRNENLYEIIKEVVNIYHIYAIAKGIRIDINAPHDLRIELSKEYIKKMLHNLIQNAVKYSFKRKGYIKIEIEELKEHIRLIIENFGVGILPEEIESNKIFENGYRGKFSSDWNRTGSGIGLAEAKRITEKHKGDLKVFSKSVETEEKKLDINTPFVTTVVVTLPKSQRRRKK